MGYKRNRVTGEVVFVPDGPARPPMNPELPYKGPQASANLNQTGAQTVNTQTNTQKTAQEIQQSAEEFARTRRQYPISKEDQAFINGLRQQQGDLGTVLRDITAAQGAVDRFQTSPGRGRLYGAGTPTDEDGFFETIGKEAVGMWLPDKTQEDYQSLLGLQNQNVLNSQIAQKGPQTEADAARMKLAGVSPNKDVRPNARLLAENQYDVMMKQRLPGFYTTWANNLGSINKPNSQGQTADEVWAEQYQRGLRRMRSDPGYTGKQPRRLGGARQTPRRVIDFNDLP